ncbi:hypothetical protein MP228_011431 [Amoeboaphelidium protococcarum]|nr:hypothetical protein MP228_011431 [Amoeboaphelidium protococcarum]
MILRGRFKQVIHGRRWQSDVASRLRDIPVERIRNFTIIAHIDHGKSTCAQRLLEHTGTIRFSDGLYMDKLKVEKERGITVKAQTASMIYQCPDDSQHYLLNMVDSPGHNDFSHEVERSLTASDGALLLVDASQGIQAQTLANYNLAKLKFGLDVIPVLNKIDLPHSNVQRVTDELQEILGIEPRDLIQISAKSGHGIQELIKAVVGRVRSPAVSSIGDNSLKMQSLLFDSWHDVYEGPIILVVVQKGEIKRGDTITSYSKLGDAQTSYTVTDCGIMHPERQSIPFLRPGMIGYLVLSNVKSLNDIIIGDTLYQASGTSAPIINVDTKVNLGKSVPKIFASLFPSSVSEFDQLQYALNKLMLTDSSLNGHVSKTKSAMLGLGFRLGFEGLLHMDVVRQRIQDEHGLDVLVCAPSVPYKVVYKTNLSGKKRELAGKTVMVENPVEFPTFNTDIQCFQEPMIESTMIFPDQYVGEVIKLCEERRGTQIDMSYIGNDRLLLKYELPLAEVSESHFFATLKAITSGYASFDYVESQYKESDLVKIEIALNNEVVDAFSAICHRSVAEAKGRRICAKLKEIIPRDLFEVKIQALMNGKSLARETISAYRKDVTAKLYGGDQTRKRKLLDKQKEGKKKMRQIGKVQIPHDAFIKLVSL